MIQNGLFVPKMNTPKPSFQPISRHGSPNIIIFYDDADINMDVKLFINYLKRYIKTTTYLIDFQICANGPQLASMLIQKYKLKYRCFIFINTGSSDLLKHCVPFFRNNPDTLCFNTFSTFNFENGVLPFNVIRTSANDSDLVNYIKTEILYNLTELTSSSNLYSIYQNLPKTINCAPNGDKLPIFSKIVYIYTDLDDRGNPDIYASGYLNGLEKSILNDQYIEIKSFLLKRDNFILPDEVKLLLTENPVSGQSFTSSDKTMFFINGFNPNTLFALLTDENMYDNYFMLSDAYSNAVITTLHPIKYGLMPIGNFSFGGYKFAGLIDSPTGQSISPQILAVVDLIVEMSPIYAKCMLNKQTIKSIKTTLENLKYIVDNNYWFEQKIFTYLSTTDVTNSNILSHQYIFFQFKFNPLTSGTFISPDEVSETITDDATDVGNMSLRTFLTTNAPGGLSRVNSAIKTTDVPYFLMLPSSSEYNTWVTALNTSVGGSRINPFVNGSSNHTPLMFELWRSHDSRFTPINLSCTVNLLLFANVPTVYTINATTTMTQKTYNTWQQEFRTGSTDSTNMGTYVPSSTNSLVPFSINIETDPLLPEDLSAGIVYVQYFSGHIYKGYTTPNSNIGLYGNFSQPVLTNNSRVYSRDANTYNFGTGTGITGWNICHTHALSAPDTGFFGNKSISIGPNGESNSFPIGSQCMVLSNVGFITCTMGAGTLNVNNDLILSFWAIGIDSNNVSTVGETTSVYIQDINDNSNPSTARKKFTFSAPVGTWTRYNVPIGQQTTAFKWGFISNYYVNTRYPNRSLKTAIQIIDCATGHYKGLLDDYKSPLIVKININPTIVYNSFVVGDYVWCIPPDKSAQYPGQVTEVTSDFQLITVQKFAVDTNQTDDALYCYIKKNGSIPELATFGQQTVTPLASVKSGIVVDTSLWGAFVDKTLMNSSGANSNSNIISIDKTAVVPNSISVIAPNYRLTPLSSGITQQFKMIFKNQVDYADWFAKCSAELSTQNVHTLFFWELCRSNKLRVCTVYVDVPIQTTSIPTSYIISTNVSFTSVLYNTIVSPATTPSNAFVSRNIDIYLNTPLIISSTTDKICYLMYYLGDEYAAPNLRPPISGNTDFQSISSNYRSPLLFVISIVPPKIAPTLPPAGGDTLAPPVPSWTGYTGSTSSAKPIVTTLGATGNIAQTWKMVGASGVYWTSDNGQSWIINVPAGVTAPTSMAGATLVSSGPSPPSRVWGGTGWIYAKGLVDSSEPQLKAIGALPFPPSNV
jgi:hypothetical protein